MCFSSAFFSPLLPDLCVPILAPEDQPGLPGVSAICSGSSSYSVFFFSGENRVDCLLAKRFTPTVSFFLPSVLCKSPEGEASFLSPLLALEHLAVFDP